MIIIFIRLLSKSVCNLGLFGWCYIDTCLKHFIFSCLQFPTFLMWYNWNGYCFIILSLCASVGFMRSASSKFSILFFNTACGSWSKHSSVRYIPSKIPSVSSPSCSSFESAKVRLSLSYIPIVSHSIPDLVMKLLGLTIRSSKIIQGTLLMTWVAFNLWWVKCIGCTVVGLLSQDIVWNN